MNNLERARRYIACTPGAVSGDGGHNRTFAVACSLVHTFHLDYAQAMVLLGEYNERCMPRWSPRELDHKVRSALKAPPRSGGSALGVPGRKRTTLPAASAPALNPVATVERLLGGFRCGEAELSQASVVKLPQDWKQGGATLLDHLFRKGEVVNFVVAFSTPQVGKAVPSGRGVCIEQEVAIHSWRAGGSPQCDGGGWLRMNPLDGRGITDANVAAFRFALVECDSIPLPLQIALLAKLPLPIAAIIASGGRSVHAWVEVNSSGPDEYRTIVAKMLRTLAHCGVDTNNKNPSRLSRMPGARRLIGGTPPGHQKLLYLNPTPTSHSIL